MTDTFTRNEYTLKFDGPLVQNHEMPLELLATELLAFQKIIETTNIAVNTKDNPISIKVKSGFSEGSLLTTIIVDFLIPIVPLVPDLVQCAINVFELKKFLGGNAPQKVIQEGNKVEVTNVTGDVRIINNYVYNAHNSAPVSNAISKFADPMSDNGLNSISLTSALDEFAPPLTLVPADKPSLLPSPEEQLEERTAERVLQFLTAQFDGKPTGWRFYDLEDDTEFTATMGDPAFLAKVTGKERSFQKDDCIRAMVYEVKKMCGQRKRTERTITDVIEFVRPDAA